MKKFDLVIFNFEDFSNILNIQKTENVSRTDALEIYAKRNPGKIKDLGTIDETGHMTKTVISSEGVETKEVNFSDELEKIVKKEKDSSP